MANRNSQDRCADIAAAYSSCALMTAGALPSASRRWPRLPTGSRSPRLRDAAVSLLVHNPWLPRRQRQGRTSITRFPEKPLSYSSEQRRVSFMSMTRRSSGSTFSSWTYLRPLWFIQNLLKGGDIYPDTRGGLRYWITPKAQTCCASSAAKPMATSPENSPAASGSAPKGSASNIASTAIPLGCTTRPVASCVSKPPSQDRGLQSLSLTARPAPTSPRLAPPAQGHPTPA